MMMSDVYPINTPNGVIPYYQQNTDVPSVTASINRLNPNLKYTENLDGLDLSGIIPVGSNSGYGMPQVKGVYVDSNGVPVASVHEALRLGGNSNQPNWFQQKIAQGKTWLNGTDAKQTVDKVGNDFKNLNGFQKLQTVAGSLKSLYDIYAMHKTMKLAKEQMAYQKMTSERDFNNSARETNRKLEERQARRLHEAEAIGQGGSVMAVSDYMAKNGVR